MSPKVAFVVEDCAVVVSDVVFVVVADVKVNVVFEGAVVVVALVVVVVTVGTQSVSILFNTKSSLQ